MAETLGFPQEETSFTRYSLDESEFELEDLQRAVIQNAKADTAQQLINLEDVEGQLEQVRLTRAWLKGQLVAFQYLLDLSEATKTK